MFGGLLLFTAIRMLVEKKEKKIEIEKNIAVRILKKFLPITTDLHENKFLIKKTNLDKITTFATPMLVALIIIEATDLVFALDSIPAILAITTDTFIVITSNLFAILGLRSLYFLLAGMMDKFYYLKPGLAAILALRHKNNYFRLLQNPIACLYFYHFWNSCSGSNSFYATK